MKDKTKSATEDYIIPREGFVRQPVVLKVFGISKTTLWRRIQDGSFPRPVKLSPKTSAWRVKDIRAVISRYDEPEPSNDQTR